MKVFGKILGLLLASLVLVSCGGSGGNGGAFSPPQSGSITLAATTTTLPLNASGLLPHDHGPNQAEVNITLRNADGSLMVGHDVQVSISPVEVAALSFLVTTDNPNFDTLWGTFAIKGTNGQATAWVNAGATAGTAVLTASVVDPTTSRTISQTLTFTITSGVGAAPASVTLVPNPTGVYLPSSGGGSTSTLTATVRDGGNQLVPDPVSGNAGVDNIQFEIVGGAGDARLSSNSVAGSVSGTSVTSHTVHGVATASFQAGAATPQGPIQIRATVDRADNNVSNGIQDPVTSTTSVIVSDGKLYSLVITSPSLDSLRVNPPVSSGVTLTPDGTYSLTVSAQAQDKQGRPVTSGTPIAFGAIDSPLVGFPDQGAGSFAIQGNDGNPQEGGILFTAPTGHFTSAGGGAGPGDTLLVFGKAVQGNDDLESARVIANLNSSTSLNVTRPFNPNDYGNVVDYGPVLPYVIGRATEVNITASAVTNNVGVATAEMTFPVSRLGKAVYIWAQADGGPTLGGGTRLVSAISAFDFVGEAPATLSASPSPIAGNTTTFVTVCAKDARNEALQGVFIDFAFQGVAGQAILDAQSGSGTFSNPTGSSGCVSGSITTSGIAAAGVAHIQFSAGPNLSITVPISPVGNGLLLQVSPSALPPSGGSVAIQVTGSDGSPQAGVGVSVTCTGGVSSSLPGPTNASGQTSATISNPGLVNNTGGSCVYTAGGTGGPSATVTVTAPPTGGTPPTSDLLSLVMIRSTGMNAASVASNPSGINCTLPPASPSTLCSASFPTGATILLTATTAATLFTWQGACTETSSGSKTATVTLSAAATCTFTVNN